MKRSIKTMIRLDTFGGWDSSIHRSQEQKIRIQRALRLGEFSSYDKKNITAVYSGSHDEPYHVTLDTCTCPDFEERGLPCKHMYRLAMKKRLFSSTGKTMPQTWQFWVGVFFLLGVLFAVVAPFAKTEDGQSAFPVLFGIGFFYFLLSLPFFYWSKHRITKIPANPTSYVTTENRAVPRGNYRFQPLPIDTSAYNKPSPTEKQLWFMRDLGIQIPDGITIDDASEMISRVENNDIDQPPIGLVQYLQQLGAQPSPYIGKLATIDAIRSRLQGAGQPAFYAYAVHCSMQGAPLGNMSLSPHMREYFNFGNEVLGNDRFMKSLEGRPDLDYYEPNRSTAAYIVAEDYLRKLPTV